jgi:hypothetical protein
LEFLQNQGCDGKDPRISIEFKNCFSTRKRGELDSWSHGPDRCSVHMNLRMWSGGAPARVARASDHGA